MLSAIPLSSAFAATITYTYNGGMPNVSSTWGAQYQDKLDIFTTFEEFTSNFKVTYDESINDYILYDFRDQYINSESTLRPYCYRSSSFFFVFENASYTSNGNCIEYTGSSIKLYRAYQSLSFKSEDSTQNSGGSGTPLLLNSYSASPCVKYYTDTHYLEVYNDDSLVYSIEAKEQNFETNIYNPNNFNLDVTFTPYLSGELDRKIIQNGVEAESNYFSMNIENTSGLNGQFAVLIVDKGAQLSFQPTKTAQGLTGITIFDGKSIYSLLYDEWIYSPYGGGRISSGHNSIEHEINSKSVWHIVKGNSTYTRNFKWSQIPIEKGKEYDVVVCAMPTSYEKPTLSFLDLYNYPHYLDISQCSVVYRSSFSVLNPVAYDASDSEFGNTPNNGLTAAEQEANKGSAFVDDNGEVVVGDINGWDTSKDLHDNWEPGIIEKESGGFDFDFSLTSLQGILGQATGFFNFLGNVFSFFPSWFIAIILFGVSSLIVIAIVKAVL